MQRTRLNNLITIAEVKLELLFSNPWRRIALSFISILMGFFMGSAIVTTAGQDAAWDVTGAATLFVFTEIVSKLVYSRKVSNSNQFRDSLLVNTLNLFKIGLTYSLFLEAFKLGS
ncbi:MAG: DUF565 domain-containing protein [Xenococcaceae cyanobacterium MO_167.B52]|nr:DUF565 domain-containing protein [Xenococcaceae cyanobacterium MO_167.B52]